MVVTMDSGVVTITTGGQSCSSGWSRSTRPPDYADTSYSTLRAVRNNGIVLYNRVSTEGYEERQCDILAVSGMAEDIRDALLEYQVGIE